ncbi:serine/arginine-rich splicing factor 6 [Uranotaenia lowii]|uniref:serine/arginine-rich splicing factor 6 n=1 Tax=Uranotaenia lowii TaxID=190385 RepID=UPI002479707D|nr:serine/arginine-rich splicing factor 6 [Uranotaenia lowii]
MNSISKIHFNSSTGLSLNDRFTYISKVAPPEKSVGGGGGGGSSYMRKRSNSVDSYGGGRIAPGTGSRGSLANRQLVSQLDRRHVSQRTPLALRNRNIRSGRQRLNRNFAARNQLRRAAGNTLNLSGGSRRLQRSNSLSDIATMNADYVERQSLRRSNSQLSIASRLGRGRSRSRGRPMQRSNSSMNLDRGRSRGRSRSRSRTRMPPARMPPARSRSRGNLSRVGSRGSGLNNLNGNGNGRSRSRGRIPLTGRRPASRAGAGRGNMRSGSVNGRLGLNRTNRPLPNGARAGRGGRIIKRGPRRGALVGGQGGPSGRGRPGRALQRGGPNAGGAATRRGRSRTRGRAASQNRARSGQRRGRNVSRGRRASAPNPKSKEDLDKELDQYMANTKSSLDKEMDEYMNGIHSSTI